MQVHPEIQLAFARAHQIDLLAASEPRSRRVVRRRIAGLRLPRTSPRR